MRYFFFFFFLFEIDNFNFCCCCYLPNPAPAEPHDEISRQLHAEVRRTVAGLDWHAGLVGALMAPLVEFGAVCGRGAAARSGKPDHAVAAAPNAAHGASSVPAGLTTFAAAASLGSEVRRITSPFVSQLNLPMQRSPVMSPLSSPTASMRSFRNLASHQNSSVQGGFTFDKSAAAAKGGGGGGGGGGGSSSGGGGSGVGSSAAAISTAAPAWKAAAVATRLEDLKGLADSLRAPEETRRYVVDNVLPLLGASAPRVAVAAAELITTLRPPAVGGTGAARGGAGEKRAGAQPTEPATRRWLRFFKFFLFILYFTRSIFFT
jgi:hypothetical protein